VESDSKYISTEVAFMAIKRRSLSEAQRKFLKAILEASPSWVSAEALIEETGYEGPRFSGLLGAWGRRVANTEGYLDGTWTYDQKWDYESDCYLYRLPSQLVEPFKRAGL